MCHEMVRQGGWVEEENIDVSFHFRVLSQDLKLNTINVLSLLGYMLAPGLIFIVLLQYST